MESPHVPTAPIPSVMPSLVYEPLEEYELSEPDHPTSLHTHPSPTSGRNPFVDAVTDTRGLVVSAKEGNEAPFKLFDALANAAASTGNDTNDQAIRNLVTSVSKETAGQVIRRKLQKFKHFMKHLPSSIRSHRERIAGFVVGSIVGLAVGGFVGLGTGGNAAIAGALGGGVSEVVDREVTAHLQRKHSGQLHRKHRKFTERLNDTIAHLPNVTSAFAVGAVGGAVGGVVSNMVSHALQRSSSGVVTKAGDLLRKATDVTVEKTEVALLHALPTLHAMSRSSIDKTIKRPVETVGRRIIGTALGEAAGKISKVIFGKMLVTGTTDLALHAASQAGSRVAAKQLASGFRGDTRRRSLGRKKRRGSVGRSEGGSSAMI